jgi:hypothetical protein
VVVKAHELVHVSLLLALDLLLNTAITEPVLTLVAVEILAAQDLSLMVLYFLVQSVLS